MSSRIYPYEIRRAAVDDYTSSGDTLTAVANRHGVSRNALNDWVRSEEGIGLTEDEGDWVLCPVRRIQVWKWAS